MHPIVDTNVYLSRWPFRRVRFDETPELVDQLRQENVVQAWAGSFDGLLHRDIAAVNQRLADDCRRYGDGLLVPFGSINPMLPDWEDDVRRCAEQHGMPGIRLHPNYHSYTLEDPRFARLLEITGQHGLIVQLAMRMEDVRTHHPLVKVPDVDFNPLPDVLRQFPEQRIELLNAMRYMSMQQAGDLANAGQIYFEFSMLEHVGGIEILIRSVALERVLFGSYFPFFYFESATLKMQESDLDGAAIKAFNVENARQLVTAKGNVAPTRQR